MSGFRNLPFFASAQSGGFRPKAVFSMLAFSPSALVKVGGQMNLQDIGAIGEAIGGIAVIFTLLYLSLQIRQNTKAIRSSSFHGVTDSFNAINNLIAHDESLARIFRVGMGGLDHLNDDEKVRFSFMFMGPFRIFETIYFQRETGTVDPRLWEAEKRSMRFLLSGPGSQEWWRSNPLSFTPEFREFVNSEIFGKTA